MIQKHLINDVYLYIFYQKRNKMLSQGRHYKKMLLIIWSDYTEKPILTMFAKLHFNLGKNV